MGCVVCVGGIPITYILKLFIKKYPRYFQNKKYYPKKITKKISRKKFIKNFTNKKPTYLDGFFIHYSFYSYGFVCIVVYTLSIISYFKLKSPPL